MAIRYYHTDRYHGTDSNASNSIHDNKNNKDNTNKNNMIRCYGRGRYVSVDRMYLLVIIKILKKQMK